MVKQEFLRRIDGYNRPFILPIGATLAPNGSVVCTLPVGPGRIDRIQINADSNLSYQVAADNIKVVIDGITICDGPINAIWQWNAALSPFPTYAYNVEGTATVIFDAIVCYDYESSCVITVTNNLAGPSVWHFVTLVGKVGR